jgi:hypothetical protein
MRCTILAIWCFTIAIPGLAAKQSTGLDALPRCEDGRITTSGWQQVTFRQFELMLPAGVRPEWGGPVFDHGGQRWAGEGLTVSLSLGYYGPSSFDSWKGNRCRAEINGETALVIEQVSEAGALMGVWPPGLRLPMPGPPYQPFLTAGSSRREDLPLLRTIVSSLKMSSQ